ncbi:MAG: hypothetical protein ACFFD4_38625, partial [Candidatus Odinarchaeota archaeon]
IGWNILKTARSDHLEKTAEEKYFEEFLKTDVEDKSKIEEMVEKKELDGENIYRLKQYYTFLDPYKVYYTFKGSVEKYKTGLRMLWLFVSIFLLLVTSALFLAAVNQLTGEPVNLQPAIINSVTFGLYPVILAISIFIKYYRYRKGFNLFIDEIAKKLEYYVLKLSLDLENTNNVTAEAVSKLDQARYHLKMIESSRSAISISSRRGIFLRLSPVLLPLVSFLISLSVKYFQVVLAG